MLECLLTYAVGLGLASTPLWVLYPLAKRVTDWPQAVLGLTFNWGALVGWAAVHGACHWPAVAPLYAGGVLWTLHVRHHLWRTQTSPTTPSTPAGVRSSARALGESARPDPRARRRLHRCCISLARAPPAMPMPPALVACRFGAGVGAAAALLGVAGEDGRPAQPRRLPAQVPGEPPLRPLVFAAIVVGKLAQRREEPDEEAERAAASEQGEPFAIGRVDLSDGAGYCMLGMMSRARAVG